ncbi:MAG: peptidylprolyl isomerase [Verrucomicrobiaceae bacterium]
METSMGNVTIALNQEKAPITVENFLTYVDKKFYDNTIFHRVMDGFMIQGGGFELKEDIPTEKPNGKPIKNEGQNGLKNDTGTIAMARTSDIDSATSQFFINVADNAGLNYPSNGGYAVFGKVTEGMDVVNKIKGVATSTKYMNSITPGGRIQPGAHQNVPVEPVIIKSIRRAKKQ